MKEDETPVGISLWATAAIKRLTNSNSKVLCKHTAGGFNFEVKIEGDSLWVTTGFGKKQYTGFRVAYSPDGYNAIEIITNNEACFEAHLSAAIGNYKVTITWPHQQPVVLHYTASLQTERNLFVPFWPRDIIAYGRQEPEGEIHISQIGARSGLLYASFKKKHKGFISLSPKPHLTWRI